jgi:hypothetical protein
MTRSNEEAMIRATSLETADNDVRRAVSTWDDCDIAALVESGGDVGPVTRIGPVVEIRELDAFDSVLVKVNLR